MGIHTPSGKAAAARHKDQAVSYLVGVFVDVVRVAVGNLNEDGGLIEHVEGDGGRQAEFQGEFKVGLHNLVLLHSATKEPLDWKKEKKEKKRRRERRRERRRGQVRRGILAGGVRAWPTHFSNHSLCSASLTNTAGTSEANERTPVWRTTAINKQKQK